MRVFIAALLRKVGGPKQLLSRASNMSMRVLSLALKAGLTLYMARYLGLEAAGLYGLLTAMVYLGGILLGFGFTQHSERAAVGMTDTELMLLWRMQTLLALTSYACVGLVIWGLSVSGAVTLPALVMMAAIVCGEHYVATTNVLMVAQHRPVSANACLFLSSGLWVPFVIGLGLLRPEYRTFGVVLAGWLCGLALNIAVTLWLWRRWPWPDIWAAPFDATSVKMGLGQSFPLWVGLLTVALGNGMERVFIQRMLGLEMLGVFTVFWSFCAAAQALVNSGVMSFQGPYLIKAARAGAWNEVQHISRQTWLMVLAGGGGVIASGMVALWLLLPFMRQPLIADNYVWGCLLLAATLLGMLGDVAVQLLYARREDKTIWTSNMAAGAYRVIGPPAGMALLGFPGVVVSRIIESGALLAYRLGAARSL